MVSISYVESSLNFNWGHFLTSKTIVSGATSPKTIILPGKKISLVEIQ